MELICLVLRIGFLCFSLVMAVHPMAQAYFGDQIHASESEVWEAAAKVFKPYGVYKQKKYKKLTTRWNEDQVSRRRGLLRNYRKQSYDRRYRIHMELKEEHNFTHTSIKIEAQEKPFGSIRELMWRKAKTDYQEEQMEKEIFMKIINELSTVRKSSSTQA